MVETNQNNNSCTIEFGILPPTGYRFRYESEINKKCYSLLKSGNNKSLDLKINTTKNDTNLVVKLVTDDGKTHFHNLYEVQKDGLIRYGCFQKTLKHSGFHLIKLDLGIRKMKNKEAMVRIKELYPKMKDSEAKSFFNKNKDAVRLKASCYNNEIPACHICSDVIKSQTSKENKMIKIKHFAPKVVADLGEELILVLEKKITTDDFKATLTLNAESCPLKPIEQDGQTFVFNLPLVNCLNSTNGKFTMKCGENSDSKPIKFLPHIESRKRKEVSVKEDSPLKRINNYDPQDNQSLSVNLMEYITDDRSRNDSDPLICSVTQSDFPFQDEKDIFSIDNTKMDNDNDLDNNIHNDLNFETLYTPEYQHNEGMDWSEHSVGNEIINLREKIMPKYLGSHADYQSNVSLDEIKEPFNDIEGSIDEMNLSKPIFCVRKYPQHMYGL